ncbi:methyl-accepting chemotaxis protein [Pseudobutyrivibrio sp. UC1225]|uniref:methyl-accepting chemotaxis protein n=1 Tax=Pseudobutyrivibrio sp. UC1225 TaxID=1798185 RepID=UPI0008E0BBB9|nr:methyl-accepting chemotaxis protein [Pseudobutyrivibrio sp. UC1225]SFO20686.1 methyl-accepting chemotaxis protein [Pseudobutyrivibrio sp. UC1225]
MDKKEGMVSIKTKLLGVILPVVILIVVLLIGISYIISKNLLTQYSQNLLRSSIESQASEIESWLNENLAAFQIVKQTIEGTQPDEEQLQGMLDQYYGFDDNYPDGLYIGEQNGRIITAGEFEGNKGSVTDSIWYNEGLTRLNMGFTSAYTNAAGEAVISASGILNDKSGVLKVLSADMSLQRISIIVNSFVQMDDAQTFLVDASNGTILAHRDNSLISTKISSASGKFLQGAAAKIADYDLTPDEIDKNITYFMEVEGTNWILVSYVPSAVVYKDVKLIRTAMIIIGAISLLLLGILIARVVHIVISPVKNLTEAITAMTDGDFTVSVDTKSRDEIGLMSVHVEKFIDSMRQMISSIHGVSGKLHMQADNSTTVSGQMYDASRTQSQSMQELNNTVEQLSVSVNEIAENATTLAMVVAETRENGAKVDTKMKETVEVSEEGKTDMQNVGDAMKSINDSVTKLQAAIDKVGTASGEITNITSVISNIAEETNLLSLNASIEAARVGEAGKGFAVVATEIGKLAKNSAESVSSIEGLIYEINELVKDAVAQADNSVDNINNSSELVGGALKTFDVIFANIDEVNTLVQEMIEKVEKVDEVASSVAAISEEQAASSEEILATSDNMVEQANHITGNSETVASDAKELTRSAEELANQVAMFKIEKEEN